MCTYTVVTHPCNIPPLAQARPMMLCIYTSLQTGGCLIQVSLYSINTTGTRSSGHKKDVAVYNGYNYMTDFHTRQRYILPTISEISQSLHPVSSLPSVQSRVPSQWLEERIHVPLVHRNAPLEQETVTVGSKDMTGEWELESGNKDCLCYKSDMYMYM